MATISFKVFDKSFKNVISKEAYLSACKWIAQNIISKKLENLTYKIEKKEETKIPTFVVSIFLNVDEEKIHKNFCDKCKHLYNTFYQLDRMNCNECRMRAYRKNTEEYTKGLIEFYKGVFKDEDK